MNKTSIQSLFGLSQPCSTLGCSASDVTSLLSKMLAPSGIAVLAISYPEVDERNHRSLDTLAHKLIAHGFNEAAENVKAYAPYILFEDLAECMKVPAGLVRHQRPSVLQRHRRRKGRSCAQCDSASGCKTGSGTRGLTPQGMLA
jgi:hypothetical protein